MARISGVVALLIIPGAAAGLGAATAIAAVEPSIVVVSASSTLLPATGTSQSEITVSVTGVAGAIVGDLVSFSAPPACGSVTPFEARTGVDGTAAALYTSSESPGVCIVTATATADQSSGSVTVTQTADSLTLSAVPASLPPRGGRVTVTAEITSGRQPVAGDIVAFAVIPLSCGGFSPTSSITSITGRVSDVYTAESSNVFCRLEAVDETSGGSGAFQFVGAEGFPTGIVELATHSVTVGTRPALLPPDGRATSVITASVENVGTAEAGQTVRFRLSGPGCGRIAPAEGASGGSGLVTATYTAAATAGSCLVTALDTAEGTAGWAVIDQRDLLTLAARPGGLTAGTQTVATITASVLDGAPPAGHRAAITFLTRGSVCGTLHPQVVVVGSNGEARTTYRAGTGRGLCTIEADDAGEHLAAVMAIDQTRSPAGNRGFWLATRGGHLYAFGEAKRQWDGSPAANRTVPQGFVAMAEAPTGGGYWLMTRAGLVFAFGSVGVLGSAENLRVPSNAAVGIAAAPSGAGYWIATRQGDVYGFGSARFLGSPRSRGIRPDDVVSITAAPAGFGYWLVTADGHVYAFGSAHDYGSPGARGLHGGEVVGLAPSGATGYWVATAAGEVFNFGAAPALRLAASATANPVPPSPVVGIAATSDGRGYWLAGGNGSVTAYGDAVYLHYDWLPADVVAIASY
ncbi:MAG TPA: hypothetical protein VMW47_06650 [Verrucomicrobiae bacterium]|nr:hypothetical protein [Verrucomicrobiae bacterium]